MSLLQACGLDLGCSFFMRWQSSRASEPLVPVVVLKAEVFEDISRSRIKLRVRRRKNGEEEDNECDLQLVHNEESSVPSMSFVETEEDVYWTLSPNHLVQGAESTSGGVVSTGLDLGGEHIARNAFRRPIRAILYVVNSILSKFPTVSLSDMRVHAHRVRKELRANTSCSLEEWESLVQYITNTLKLPAEHDPPYCAADVPRYDTTEMCLQFGTLVQLLKVFRHLTRSNLRKLAIKRKTIRRRRRKTADGTGSPVTIFDMVELIGDYVGEHKAFAFVVGGTYLENIHLPTTYRFPMLFRESMEWNDCDRMFEDELELRMMKRAEVQSVYNEKGARTPARLPSKSAISKEAGRG